VKNLIYVHTNLCLLSRSSAEYKGLWDIGGDGFETFQDADILDVNLSFDEPTMEAMVFADDEGGDEY